MLRQVPLIVILGSTGVGKTKLSIDIAKRFAGEIISADSMQVYKGLSIATAKATSHERSQAPHHMLDIATPNEEFTVKHFRDMALPLIDNLLQSSKIPIIVGGTNYYIESILWQILVAPCSGKRKIDDANVGEKLNGLEQEVKDFIEKPSMVDEMYSMESAKLHEYLKQIDPSMANRLHPNNKRKIMSRAIDVNNLVEHIPRCQIQGPAFVEMCGSDTDDWWKNVKQNSINCTQDWNKALEVFKDHGKRLSEIIGDQRRLPGASNLGGPRRYENVIIFWLQCEQETLNQRLECRVNSMVKDGLLEEIRSFYDAHVDKRDHVDYEEGILQTIGFKEFIPYLEKFDKTHDRLINRYVESTQTSEVPDGWEALKSCLEELKAVTQRYSKKQQKWIKNRFSASDLRETPTLYPLDTTDVAQWNELVSQPAIETIESFIANDPIQLEPMKKHIRLGEGLDEETSHLCSVCDRVFIGEYQFQLHMKSNKHKRMKASIRKREEKLVEARLKMNEKTLS